MDALSIINLIFLFPTFTAPDIDIDLDVTELFTFTTHRIGHLSLGPHRKTRIYEIGIIDREFAMFHGLSGSLSRTTNI